MTKVTVKSAEIAKAIVAAIMPSATEENSQNMVLGKKKQNRFFEDAATAIAWHMWAIVKLWNTSTFSTTAIRLWP